MKITEVPILFKETMSNRILFKGTVTYDAENKKCIVRFSNKELKKKIKSHLATKREFIIPESQQIDDYRIEKAVPVENETFWSLAMGCLYINTGVWVDWVNAKKY